MNSAKKFSSRTSYKQRGKIDKLDASSPTAALESVLLTAVIDAREGRDVAVIDIPNAFVQTRLEDDAESDYAHAGKTCRAHGQGGSRNIHEVRHHQFERRDSFVRPSTECPLWHHESWYERV